LNVVPIDIAPLRERRDDIADLVNLFISRFAGESRKPVEGITPEAMQILVNYHWPGNVRELQNIVERACALAKGNLLEAADIHLDVRPAKSANGTAGFLPDGLTLEQWEDEMVQEALRRANGNKSQAARLLGLSRNALRYRLSKIGIADEGEREV
jgi:DNA-binding NtrC family response regulator